MEGSTKLKIYKERPREEFLEVAASLRSSQRRAKQWLPWTKRRFTSLTNFDFQKIIYSTLIVPSDYSLYSCSKINLHASSYVFWQDFQRAAWKSVRKDVGGVCLWQGSRKNRHRASFGG